MTTNDRRTMTTPSPAIREYTLRNYDGSNLTFTGSILGHGSSRKSQHAPHPETYAPRRDPANPEYQPETQCSACRWYEVSIYRLEAEDHPSYPPQPVEYLVYRVGQSIVPHEDSRINTFFTTSPYQIIEHLISRKPGSAPRLSKLDALALANAAEFDKPIEHAYVNRAVV